MGMIGAHRKKSQEKCVACENTFEEDKLTLTPYNKTKTLELMCGKCSDEQKPQVNLKSKTKDENVIKTKKKPNPKKEIINKNQEKVENAVSKCNCARLPLCNAIRATQAFDEFSNSEIRAFFIGSGFDFYKIEFCPFCGKSLYK